ncbi:hypothetical protein GLW08_07520 [Pontibacillus yanchengensis]|uniref:Uncharacterized protein n=1 Tax=Pontibacillus yanchengensis TaxID=462910 RepID=A0ACC7VDY7_9BACI|nr:hypothetical protein [Pontibacillus yanchengensis]
MASVLWIIKMTIFPLEIGVPHKYGINHNFTPFTSMQSMLNHSYFMVPLRNIVGNIILFMPLGFVLSLKYGRLKSVKRVGIVGLLSSLFIEVSQLFLPIRAFDIDDIILNTLGAILGYLVLKTFEKISYKIKGNNKDALRQHGTNEI